MILLLQWTPHRGIGPRLREGEVHPITLMLSGSSGDSLPKLPAAGPVGGGIHYICEDKSCEIDAMRDSHGRVLAY